MQQEIIGFQTMDDVVVGMDAIREAVQEFITETESKMKVLHTAINGSDIRESLCILIDPRCKWNFDLTAAIINEILIGKILRPHIEKLVQSVFGISLEEIDIKLSMYMEESNDPNTSEERKTELDALRRMLTEKKESMINHVNEEIDKVKNYYKAGGEGYNYIKRKCQDLSDTWNKLKKRCTDFSAWCSESFTKASMPTFFGTGAPNPMLPILEFLILISEAGQKICDILSDLSTLLHEFFDLHIPIPDIVKDIVNVIGIIGSLFNRLGSKKDQLIPTMKSYRKAIKESYKAITTIRDAYDFLYMYVPPRMSSIAEFSYDYQSDYVYADDCTYFFSHMKNDLSESTPNSLNGTEIVAAASSAAVMEDQLYEIVPTGDNGYTWEECNDINAQISAIRQAEHSILQEAQSNDACREYNRKIDELKNKPAVARLSSEYRQKALDKIEKIKKQYGKIFKDYIQRDDRIPIYTTTIIEDENGIKDIYWDPTENEGSWYDLPNLFDFDPDEFSDLNDDELEESLEQFKKTFVIKVESMGNGNVIINGETNSEINAVIGEYIYVCGIPNPGYRFVKWNMKTEDG